MNKFINFYLLLLDSNLLRKILNQSLNNNYKIGDKKWQ